MIGLAAVWIPRSILEKSPGLCTLDQAVTDVWPALIWSLFGINTHGIPVTLFILRRVRDSDRHGCVGYGV